MAQDLDDVSELNVSSLASNEEDPSEIIRRNERFYLPDDTMVIFKVENQLYKVHRYFFIRESAVFASMFTDCPPPGNGQDGDTDDKPIYLPSTTCCEFEALLEFLYYGMFKFKTLKKVNSVESVMIHSNSKGAVRDRNISRQKMEEKEEEEIFHLFAIADRYAFDNITKQLVAIIDANEVDIDPVRKLLIGSRHHDFRHWVPPAFDEIVKRSKALTVDEMRNLGYERLGEICSARESFLRNSCYEPSKETLSDVFYHA
ncbi:hypothetical protein M413DRAFT_146496 [Hebeloma cylindrosporum]|uniref:BTB domain-containing protein n=1 Tax=Hebeloma cylindrosporum TaxID=76867 RepID=A0A0C2YJW4_HEBCY|nr:hypothetical protein M413DRAFT_146496 [Hebeloma cylindrosporum h7]